MKKIITFNEYLVVSKENQSKGLNDIFNIAWKNNPQGQRYYKNKRLIIRATTIFTLVLLTSLCIMYMNPLAAFATTLCEELIDLTDPDVASKINETVTLFKKFSDGKSLDEQALLFDEIVNLLFTKEQVAGIYKHASKYLTVGELVNTLAK